MFLTKCKPHVGVLPKIEQQRELWSLCTKLLFWT